MAKKSKQVVEPVEEEDVQEAPLGDVDEATWAKLLEDIDAASGDPRTYALRPGRNRLRLVPDIEGVPTSFFCEVQRNFRGQLRTRYLIKAMPMGRDEKEMKGVVVPKTVMKQVLNMLAEGYDLLHPTKGLGIVIVKSGEGMESSYNTLPSPKAVPLPKKYTDLDVSLKKLAEEILANDLSRNEERSNEAGSNSRAKGGRKATQAALGGDDW